MLFWIACDSSCSLRTFTCSRRASFSARSSPIPDWALEASALVTPFAGGFASGDSDQVPGEGRACSPVSAALCWCSMATRWRWIRAKCFSSSFSSSSR
eukprot:scaffold438_cov250-Pinguiococcus_pyrenoidosus.AAC.18